MKKLLLGVALAASMLAAAPAFAATTITLNPPAADGTIVGGYEQSNITAGGFSYAYEFVFPAAGLASTYLSSVGITNSTNIDFSKVLFNGTALSISNGVVDTATLLDWPVSGGLQTLLVEGVSGGNGQFTIDIAYAPVPEPATWAMMIVGFGAAGAAIRRRKLVPSVA